MLYLREYVSGWGVGRSGALCRNHLDTGVPVRFESYMEEDRYTNEEVIYVRAISGNGYATYFYPSRCFSPAPTDCFMMESGK